MARRSQELLFPEHNEGDEFIYFKAMSNNEPFCSCKRTYVPRQQYMHSNAKICKSNIQEAKLNLQTCGPSSSFWKPLQRGSKTDIGFVCRRERISKYVLPLSFNAIQSS
jgi:hypothetical protein